MGRASNLKKGHRILGKGIQGIPNEAVLLVLSTKPSLDVPDHVVIEALSKRGRIHWLRLSNDQKIVRVHAAMKISPHSESTLKCECMNHMRTKKMLYPSRDAAIKAIVSRHLAHGTHRVRECPTEAGKFHVVSKKTKKYSE